MCISSFLLSCSNSDDDFADDKEKEEKSEIIFIGTSCYTCGYSTLEDACEGKQTVGSYLDYGSRYPLPCDIIESLKESVLLYSALEEETVKIGNYYYKDYNYVSYYKYYYSEATWDIYEEHFKNEYRVIYKNKKAIIKYLGCSKGTPDKYVPKDEKSETVITFDDEYRGWQTKSSGEITTGGSGNSGNEDSGNESGTTNTRERECEYVTHVTGYEEAFDYRPTDIYIYKRRSDGRIRASFVEDRKGLALGATEAVSSCTEKINGQYCNKYIAPYGLKVYFYY